MSTRIILTCCALVAGPLLARAGEPVSPRPTESSTSGAKLMSDVEAIELVRTFCVDCHQGDDAEGDLDLDAFASVNEVGSSIERWTKIADRVSDGTMPPLGSEAPTPASRAGLTQWIRSAIHAAVCEDGISPGGPMLRRLNRTEYANTVRDLLEIHVDAGHALPSDGAGGEGFDNAAETLFISPIHAEKYLDAAREALQHALKDPEARERLIVAEPDESLPPDEAARQVLQNFLPRAFRRPIKNEELEQYVQLFRLTYGAGGEVHSGDHPCVGSGDGFAEVPVSLGAAQRSFSTCFGFTARDGVASLVLPLGVDARLRTDAAC